MERKNPKILITRLSHIGDCVLTLPLVRAVKNLWPESHISWAMESPTGKLLGDHPDVDQVIPIPKSYLTKPKEILRLRNVLKSQNYDIVLDPQSLTKSSFLGWLSGAKTRIGMGGKWQKELSGWLNRTHELPKSSHLVDRTLSLLNGLPSHWKETTMEGRDIDFHWKREAQYSIEKPEREMSCNEVPCSIAFPKGCPEFSIPTTDEDDRWFQGALEDLGFRSVGEYESFGIINPGASWASKRWENKRYAQVAKRLFVQTGFRWIVTWAGDEELSMAKEVVESSDGACVLAPNSTLKQWTRLARSASVFLGCDTGPMHMAAAVGTPCVVLFGPTKSQDSGPYGLHHQCLQKEYQSGGAKQRRKANNDAMRKIDIELVLEACQKVTSSHSNSSEIASKVA